MNFKIMAVILGASSIQSTAAYASDAGTAVSTQSTVGISQSKGIANPSKEKIVGSDSTTFEHRYDAGTAGTTQIKSVTHGGDSSMPIDRMPAGGPLGGSGVSTGAKIPGPTGTINNKSELPSTKEEIGGGAVGAPGN